ncbi:MAG: hypothetical protein EHM86_00255 [Desulfobulbaceae bacterium]|nr:MAG: hypothetical protein EHM86_00255 [Desulfobulbaceae bacterium]
MNIFALPGINQKTERWAANLLNELAAPDRSMTVQHYRHWDSDDAQCLSLHDEVDRLKGCDIDLLIAKSLGVMIGLQACDQGLITPQRAVFIGTPVTGFREQNLDLRQLVGHLDIPCLFIQQTNDIVGSSASLRQEISALPMKEILEIPGDNHQYKDLKLLARHIKKFIS